MADPQSFSFSTELVREVLRFNLPNIAENECILEAAGVITFREQIYPAIESNDNKNLAEVKEVCMH